MKLVINFVILLLFGFAMRGQDRGNNSAREEPAQLDSTIVDVTFQSDVAPLLKTNCSPCHFEGGQVFDRYPFDDYETVKALGKKLNTRLKEQEQVALIAEWLEAGTKEK